MSDATASTPTASCRPSARSWRRSAHLPLDFRAMWAISNLFRSSAAVRRHMEAEGPGRPSASLDLVRRAVGALGVGRAGRNASPTAIGHQPPDRHRRVADPRRPRGLDQPAQGPHPKMAAWCSSRSRRRAGGPSRPLPAVQRRRNGHRRRIWRADQRTAWPPTLRCSPASVRLATAQSVAESLAASLGGHDPHRHPLDAVHEVGADPLGRPGQLDRASAGSAPGTGSSSRAARGARPDRSGVHPDRT